MALSSGTPEFETSAKEACGLVTIQKMLGVALLMVYPYTNCHARRELLTITYCKLTSQMYEMCYFTSPAPPRPVVLLP